MKNNYQDFLDKKGEGKWQKYWEKKKLFKTPENVTLENKYYILPQLPYPSGSGLHVGHAEVYSACDIFARYKRMTGKKVLQVIGWDSFGLPAENYAIKTNVHPRISTDKAIDNFRQQIKSLGISVDWDREVGAHNPDYYKWTQWFFLLFYKRGLVYRKKQSVNWCESCKTVLANDQVKEGQCERCDTVIVQRDMEQWYIKVTEYADKLLEGLDRIDWPEETKKRQRDWIGKSEGASVSFKVNYDTDDADKYADDTDNADGFVIEVFTTRPDTLFGATYLVLAPEHSAIQNLKSEISNWDKVEKYIEATSKKTDLDRQIEKEKTGVELKGIKAINPVNNEEIPIYIADYVLASYGTGAIMAVPAHDERDFEFAKKFGVGIRCVIKPREPDFLNFFNGDIVHAEYVDAILNGKECFTWDGTMVNSDFLNDLTVDEAKTKMIEWLEENNFGKRKVQYKLRDWSVSRQRFWGAPIPMLERNKKQETRNKDIILLVHGIYGHSQENWFPWFKEQMESKGYKVLIPDLPNNEHPTMDEWIGSFNNLDIKDDDNLTVVGHSLGAPTACQFVLRRNKKINKLILVGPTGHSQNETNWKNLIKEGCDEESLNCIRSFNDLNIDLDKLKKISVQNVIYLSDNDPYIPLEIENDYKELGSKVRIFHNHGHFNEGANIKKLPEILEEFDTIANLELKPVPESDLPVILPDDVDFKPTGQSPLTYSENFNAGVEEKYGKGWKREPDTLDTFMCSSWYYFRYLDPKNDGAFASPEALKKWMPVDFYLGGPEHVNGHLLYSRFFTKVLFDEGLIDFDEPFKVHRHQGLILGPDNRKMSKRWGNVVNPTDVVNEFGADTCRMYEMFMGPLADDKPWDTNGVKGVRRFLDKVWNLESKVHKVVKSEASSEIDKLVHKTIKKVTEDLESLGFNTAIAEMMKLVNEMGKQENISITNYQLLIIILTPFAPHMAEELWSNLGHKDSVCIQEWPEYDEELIKDDEITIVVQVNGKVRGDMTVSVDISEEDAKAQAIQIKNVVKWLEGKEPKKVIYVKGKLVSIVI